jgi:DNA-binding MarR family transcriptional regulator
MRRAQLAVQRRFLRQGNSHPMPESSATQNSLLNDIDRVVHEPARLKILSQLYLIESADFLFVMQQTGLTQGNLSSHMSKLEAAGYVEVRKEFADKRPRTLLRLTDDGRTAFDKYVLLAGVLGDAHRDRPIADRPVQRL